eukprot:3992789-Amphidinium_carterae.1
MRKLIGVVAVVPQHPIWKLHMLCYVTAMEVVLQVSAVRGMDPINPVFVVKSYGRVYCGQNPIVGANSSQNSFVGSRMSHLKEIYQG